MKYLKNASGFLFFVFSIITAASCLRTEYRNIDGFTQGTTFSIIYSDDAGVKADSLVEAILNRVDMSLSGYNPSSILSGVNRGDTVEVDDLFINVFEQSRIMYHVSNGLFDVSSAPLFDAWGFGFKNRESVTPQLIDSVKAFTGMDRVRIEGRRVIKEDPRVRLNFNAIAQGYTADVIAEALDSMGAKNYLVEVGGEIHCKGVNPKGKAWRIGIDKPQEGNLVQGAYIQDVILLREGGLATSGNYRKYFEEEGEKYSHSINPVTGFPAKNTLLSATVTAQSSMIADAYATFFMVAGLEKAIETIENTQGIEGYLIYSQNGNFEVYKSKGIKIR